jgi:hypothetical protein
VVVPAAAQDTLIVDGRIVGAIGGFGSDQGPAPAEASRPLAGGGRFSVTEFAITDRRTGEVRLVEPGQVIGVDPVRPRVFVRYPGATVATIAELDAVTGESRVLVTLDATRVPSPGALRYAEGVDRLYLDVSSELFSRATSSIVREVRVFDGKTGAALPGGFAFTAPPATWSEPPGPGAWLVTPQGDYAYAAEPDGLVIVELATGARRVVREPVTALRWDALNERVFAIVGASLVVLNRAGDVLGSAAMGDCHASVVSPHTGRLYVRRRASVSREFILDDLRVFDSRTYTLLGRADLSPRPARCSVTLVTAPGPPRALTATATGNTVSLAWQNVGGASHFVLDVGLAAGRTDLQVPLGADPRVTFAGVPSGVYYLRVRGGNEFGGGRASDEVRLVVP